MWPMRFFLRTDPIDKSVLINGQPFKVIGVNTRQGTFLGLFSWDSMVAMPLPAFQKIFQREKRIGHSGEGEGQDQTGRGQGRVDRLTCGGCAVCRRRRRTISAINEQQAFKSTLDPIKNSIAIAGLVHYRSFAFRRRDRDHEHHLRQREGADEGDRHAQGARRAPAHDSAAIPDRIDRALSGRRIDRTDLCLLYVFRNRRGVALISRFKFLSVSS